MNQPTIREALTSDIDSIVTYWLESFEYHQRLQPGYYAKSNNCLKLKLTQYLRKALESNSNIFVKVSENDIKISGFIIGELTFGNLDTLFQSVGKINELYVGIEFRNLGTAESLMDSMEIHLIDQGAEILELMAACNNLPALNLYTKLGYQECQKVMQRSIEK